MAMRTLLVHLAPDPDWEERLSTAIAITQHLDAHLIALYVASPVHMPPGAEGRGASAAFLAAARETARETAAGVKAQIEKLCSCGISWEYKYGDADHLEEILDEVHHVDLTIINQVSLDSFEDRLLYQFPEKLIMGAGGPVLVVPKGAHDIDLDHIDTALIAWSYAKESIRALRDALPILKKVANVKLLTTEKVAAHEKGGAGPVIDYLARHQISAESIVENIEGHAGDEILEAADAVGADLIVMGAYHGTSILDKLFGSASRYVISNTNKPVLVSH